jgi:phosphatidate cytidylyltransferase
VSSIAVAVAWYLGLDPVPRVTVLVLGVLVVATSVVWGLTRARPGTDWSELTSRIRSWWIMIGVFLLAVFTSPLLTIVVFGLLSFWALKEYLTLLPTRTADHTALVITFLVAIPGQYYFVATRWYGMVVLWIPLYMFLLLPAVLAIKGETRGFVASASQIHWGLMAFVFGLSHVPLLLYLPPGDLGSASGRSLMLFLVFIVEACDVCQYLWGKAIGKHRIMPTVSPNKTWEGLIGGVVTACALSLLLRFLTPFDEWQVVGMTALTTTTGFFGDVIMSAVKRDFGVKDFGTLLPGHGGALDRVDSLVWAAPIFLHVTRFFF